MSSHIDPSDPTVLFESLRVGALEVPNRVFLAPLTRSRAGAADVPTDLMREYYVQRASAGLMIAEATQISPQGKGYAHTPGIYSAAQIEGWKKITDAVHAVGGRMALQLWHVGRVSHPTIQENGALPVAPSAITPKTQVYNDDGFVDAVEPRALRADELPGIIEDYKTATRNAFAAGFDAIEIHSANGYLLDEFLKTGANARTDEYGGSVENRARFPLQVVDALVALAGRERVGIRIAPVTPAVGISDADPSETFGYYVTELSKRGLAYLHVIEGATSGPRDIPGIDYSVLRRAFDGVYVGNNGYDRALAIRAIADGSVDAVAFGVPFIANPDLVERLRLDAPLNKADKATFYGGDAHGYTDYPALETSARA